MSRLLALYRPNFRRRSNARRRPKWTPGAKLLAEKAVPEPAWPDSAPLKLRVALGERHYVWAGARELPSPCEVSTTKLQ